MAEGRRQKVVRSVPEAVATGSSYGRRQKAEGREVSTGSGNDRVIIWQKAEGRTATEQ
jgi:hypothetical protein